MVMTDPLSDMLTRLRNAFKASKKQVEVLNTGLNRSVLDVLSSEGYIKSYEVQEVRKGISKVMVDLKYVSSEPAMTEVKRLSKPGRRVYAMVGKIPTFYNNLGVTIVSTSSGVMTDAEARQKNIGGELLCQVF
jgi:small subunit ribosomal protein S8